MTMSGIETRLLIRPRGDRVQIRLSRRVGLMSPPADALLYGSGLAGFLGLIIGAVAKSGLVGGIAVAGLLAVLVPLVYVLDTAWRRKKHRELAALADDVAAWLSLPEGAASSTGVSTDVSPVGDATRDEVPPERPRLDDTSYDDDKEADAPAGRRRGARNGDADAGPSGGRPTPGDTRRRRRRRRG